MARRPRVSKRSFKTLSDPKVLADRAAEERRRRHQQHEREEAARRRERLTSFMAVGSLAADRHVRVWACPWCGAAVVDRDRHLSFHEHLNQTAQKADRAEFLNTPIG